MEDRSPVEEEIERLRLQARATRERARKTVERAKAALETSRRLMRGVGRGETEKSR